METIKRKGRIVRKVYELNGVPGLVSMSKCHRTKSLVGVYNVAQAGLSTDEDFPWSTVCELHDHLAGFKTLPLAKAAASDPDTFCDECKASLVAAVEPVVEAVFEIQEPVTAVG